MILDRYTIFAVSALISLVLGIILLAAQARGRIGSWATCCGAGTVALGLAGADQALKGVLPEPWLVSSGNVIAITGYALVVQGARLFAGRRPRWALMAAILIVGVLPLALSYSPQHKPARVAYNNAILIICDLWVAIEAVRLARRERLNTAWIMAGLFAVTVPFSFMRLGVALSTMLGADTLASGRVNTWLAALLAAFWSLRGAVPALLIAERSSRKLARLACHDALTGALNRAGLDRLKPTLTVPAAIVMMDLDHFKHLNDRYGHARGDDVLRLLAEVVRERLPDRGAFVRLGGDEFLLVLPNATADTAHDIAQAIRAGFAASVAPLAIAAPSPTVSVGIAAGDLARVGLDALQSEADQALYVSKQAGRDCVTIQRLAA